MRAVALKRLVTTALEELKARDVVSLDVTALTDMMDYMVVASGTSSRHVKALADRVTEEARKRGARSPGVEGQGGSEWILVDCGDVVVHVMLPSARDFYALERLWSAPASLLEMD